MASVTLYELSTYNSGHLVPKTFDLDDIPSYEDWLTAVNRWLKELTGDLGALCEEWIVADAEDVPDQYVGEYIMAATYWDYREAVESSHLEKSVFQAAAELDIPLEMVEELYQGEYENDEDFAYTMAEDIGLLQENVQWPYTCIDWQHAARELMYDYGESGSHYFRTAY
jgi:antirestriction protein